ncbi:MAG TPA: TonB family protein [Candidatus Sulfotelmatobacter sp.]
MEVRDYPALSSPQAAPVPGFVVELESWPRVFFGNLRDLIFPRPALRIESAPGIFWADVFVLRRLPWLRFWESIGLHAVAMAVLVSFSQFWSLQPVIEPRANFDRVQVVIYEPVEYLPPLDTRRAEADRPQHADPELSQQTIISLPPQADNRFQTIVAPPEVKLKRDTVLPNTALPNIVAWSEENSLRPQLAVPPAPVVLASSLMRIAPNVTDSVVAPPPDLRAALQNAIPQAPQPAVIEPPPEVMSSSIRTAGQINIGRSAVIAPAPQLALGEQRAFAGALSHTMAAQVVPPPPGASGYSGAGRRIIALNLHPAVGAPPDPPAGNRRGAFAATPDGHRGASGTPGASANAAGHGSGNKENGNGDFPAGLYVGRAAEGKTAPVAGNPVGKISSPANSVNPRLLAGLALPSANRPPHSPQPEAARLSDAERAVFGDRKFYSLSLNMPNLNSAGGSWIIRFAEIGQDSVADSAGLAAPTPIRKVDPAYPLQLMHENVAGTVIVYAVIQADGSVGAVRILRGIDDRIDPFASQAIKQWQFRPATKNGVPVDVEATFHIPFRPSRVGSSF